MNTNNNTPAQAAATTAAENTIVAFHIGRGGHFHNSGFVTFLGEKSISDFTSDLNPRYTNECAFKNRFGFDDAGKNQKCILDLINDRDFDELEEKFGITEEMLGEEIYFDNGGNSVELTVAEAETGIGRINQDNDYDTTYACKLSDCSEAELRLIKNDDREFSYLSADCQAYVKWMLDEETEVKYALASHVNDGLLCSTGDGHLVISTEFEEGERYEGDVKTFDSKGEAQAFIDEGDRDALYVVEFPM